VDGASGGTLGTLCAVPSTSRAGCSSGGAGVVAGHSERGVGVASVPEDGVCTAGEGESEGPAAGDERGEGEAGFGVAAEAPSEVAAAAAGAGAEAEAEAGAEAAGGEGGGTWVM